MRTNGLQKDFLSDILYFKHFVVISMIMIIKSIIILYYINYLNILLSDLI